MTTDIRRATAADIPVIRTVVARSVCDDPMIRWMVPLGLTDRLSRIAVYFSAQVERLVLGGVVHVAAVEGAVVGAALWVPPGTARLDALPVAGELGGIVLGQDVLDALGPEFTSARQGAPECAGAYLATLGVLPGGRDRGVGRALVEAGHAVLGAPTWLETTNPRNHSFYRRLGYELVHEAPFAAGTTTMAHFIRES